MAMVKALLCFLGTLELASREAKHKKNIQWAATSRFALLKKDAEKTLTSTVPSKLLHTTASSSADFSLFSTLHWHDFVSFTLKIMKRVFLLLRPSAGCHFLESRYQSCCNVRTADTGYYINQIILVAKGMVQYLKIRKLWMRKLSFFHNALFFVWTV